MEDQDPPLGIALATDPTVPLVEPYATRYFENDTTAIVDRSAATDRQVVALPGG